jgi:hypothetical protein
LKSVIDKTHVLKIMYSPPPLLVTQQKQRNRELSAFFTHAYLDSIQRLRLKTFRPTDKGIPLEFFEWERVIVDEVHECLLSEKDSLELDWYKEKNRKASRELLGISQRDMAKRYVCVILPITTLAIVSPLITILFSCEVLWCIEKESMA